MTNMFPLRSEVLYGAQNVMSWGTVIVFVFIIIVGNLIIMNLMIAGILVQLKSVTNSGGGEISEIRQGIVHVSKSRKQMYSAKICL